MMRSRRIIYEAGRSGGAALLVLFLIAVSGRATTLVRMNLPALAQSAHLIVRARCEGMQTRWDGGAIWSQYEFTVLETLKGAPPQLLRVRLPGGRIGHLETKIDGVPQFRAGEEAVLFVEQTSSGGYSVTSWAQGTFRVRRNVSGEPRLTQDTSHFAVFDPTTRSFTPAGIRDITLTEFRKQLIEALRAEDTRQKENVK
jgi:hypothetical protein